MRVETQFNAGDEAWVYFHGPGVVPCPHCLGRGRVTVQETGKRQKCGVCFGQREVTDYEGSWHVLKVRIFDVHVGQEAGQPALVHYRIDRDSLPRACAPSLQGGFRERDGDDGYHGPTGGLFATEAEAATAMALARERTIAEMRTVNGEEGE